MMEDKPVRICNFCTKNEDETAILIAGNSAHICGDCTQIAADILLVALRNRATKLGETIKGIEDNGGIPSVKFTGDK